MLLDARSLWVGLTACIPRDCKCRICKEMTRMKQGDELWLVYADTGCCNECSEEYEPDRISSSIPNQEALPHC